MIKKIIFKFMRGILGIAIIVMLVIVISYNNVYAEVNYVFFFNRHHLSGGVGNYGNSTQKYWISSDMSGFYYNCAKDAMLDWSNNSAIIDFKITKKRSDSVVDIYSTSDGKNAGYNAYTVYRKNILIYVNPNENNWKYAQVFYNSDNSLNSNRDKNRDKIIAVFAHEIGHCFGLDENNTNTKSIMCQAGSGTKVTSVQAGDLKGVYIIYK